MPHTPEHPEEAPPEEEDINYNPRAAKIARWQDQCFLMDARKTLSKVSKGTQGYENLIVFNARADKVIKHFAAIPDASIFFKLNTAQMALLVPTVRFWVVHYEKKDPAAGTVGEPQHKYSESKELFLDDYTTPAQVRGIEQHLRGGGRAYGIGLNNFEYEFDGGDFATTEKSIKVHVELLMTSFESLTKEQGGRNSPRWLDILLRSPKKVPKALEDEYEKGGGNDIITACREPRAKRDAARLDSELIANPAYRRIKARVGWAATDVHALVDLFEPGIRKPTAANMKALLESFQLDLFLEMTNYDFNFENDGRIRLSIDYRASVEGALREPSANIFYALQKMIKDRQASRDRKVRNLNRKKTAVQEDVSAKVGSAGDDDDPETPGAGDTPDPRSVQARLNKLDDDIQNINDAYTDLIEIWKYKHYSEFLKYMVSQGKIYEISLDKKSMLRWRGFPGRSGRGIKAGENEKTSKEYAEARQSGEHGTNSSDHTSADKILADLRATGGGNSTTPESAGATPNAADPDDTSVACESTALRKDQADMTAKARGIPGAGMRREKSMLDDIVDLFMPDDEKEVNENQDSRCADYPRPSHAGFHIMHYMYLGDLIDALMGIYHRNGKLAGLTEDDLNIRVVLTDIIAGYENILTPDRGMQPDKNKPIKLNLADLPISLDEFNAFFRRKVISPRVSQYFIMDFIKDIMTDLVYRALGDACWGGRKTPIPQITYTVFDARRTASRKEPWLKKRKYTIDGEEVHLFKRRSPSGLRKPLRLRPSDIGPDKVMHYFILHGSLRTTANRRVNRVRDEKDGIYHFGLGLNRGILKEVKFISNKLLHANTARVLNDGAAGINQLFNKFDADVELYGCPLFRNGQYIFIDPKTMGVKTVISRALGMGGYYNIYKVKGRLGRAGYSTSLKCKFNSSGICDEERDYGNYEDAGLPDDDPNAFQEPGEEAIISEEHEESWEPGEHEYLIASDATGAFAEDLEDDPLGAERKGAYGRWEAENRKTIAANGGNPDSLTEAQQKENFEKVGFPELMRGEEASKTHAANIDKAVTERREPGGGYMKSMP